jgi:DNA repair protein RadA
MAEYLKMSKVKKMAKKTEEKKESTVTDLPGVGAATAEKLSAAGYDDLLSIAVSSIGQLVEASGVSEVVARKMIQAARDGLDMGFQSGSDMLKKRDRIIKIKSGSENIDNLLAGGFETSAITECFGQYGSGKTQIGHVLAVSCQRDDPDAVAVYIDTENTFRPERIIQFAKGFDMDPDAVLERIKVARAFNSDHQMILAEKVEDLIKEGVKVRLIIVDSLTAHFRAEFVGRGTLAERQQKLNKHMHLLAMLADKYNLCVYVTNQVMAKPDAFFGDPTEAIGGHIVGHNSTFRIYLRKGKKNTRVAKLVDSPNLPDAECAFNVTEFKIEDI